MKILHLFFTVVLAASPVHAGETLISEFPWKKLADAGQLKAGEVIAEPGGASVLKVESAGKEPLFATIFTVENPKVTTSFYTLSGEVRYEAVEGDGFLEMWNHFGEAAFFSRTLGDAGPMAKLKGDSAWRAFALPFHATGTKVPLSKLVFNVQLPGKGVVWLRKLKLTQSNAAADGAWMSNRAIGWAGGIGGAVIGCLGSLLEWLAKAGKGRGFVINALRVLTGLGVVTTACGLAALALRQPYAVWFSLQLLGGLCASIFPFRLRRYRQQFREQELRRMASMDLV